MADTVLPDRYAANTALSDGRVIVEERSVHTLAFNVMPGREVFEALRVRRYVIDGHEITAEFDRAYRSEMIESPSHLVFLSALVQLQKLSYVWLCRQFGFDYRADLPEVLKIWPFDVSIRIPELITAESDLRQSLVVEKMYRITDADYWFRGTSRVGAGLLIAGSVRVRLLRPPVVVPQ